AIARLIIGAATFAKPVGSPRFRSVIVVPPGVSSQLYVVSIGNGPSEALITNRLPGTCSRTSYVYSSRRPRNVATNVTREPTVSGRGVCQSTLLMFSYH